MSLNGIHRRVICPGCKTEIVNAGSHARYSKVCTAEKRFWGRIDQSGGPDACWPWKGAITTHGYGCALFGKRVLGAHKVAYVMTKGAVPHGMQIRHSCDNPPCCNPAHLSIGTRQDNIDDKVARGRTPKKLIRKLNAEQAADIKRMRGTMTSGQLSKKYGISQSYVFTIWAGRCWK